MKYFYHDVIRGENDILEKIAFRYDMLGRGLNLMALSRLLKPKLLISNGAYDAPKIE